MTAVKRKSAIRERIAPEPFHPEPTPARKTWVRLTPLDHVLKQIEIQQKRVADLRKQLTHEEQVLAGMEKAKEYFPAT